MEKYYVNDQAQTNGDFEVHHQDCYWLPAPQNRSYLGAFATCKPAVEAAKKKHSQVNGCKHCCANCHTQ